MSYRDEVVRVWVVIDGHYGTPLRPNNCGGYYSCGTGCLGEIFFVKADAEYVRKYEHDLRMRISRGHGGEHDPEGRKWIEMAKSVRVQPLGLPKANGPSTGARMLRNMNGESLREERRFKQKLMRAGEFSNDSRRSSRGISQDR